MQERCWKGESWKLDFLTGFPDHILVWLKQLPNIETMSKGNFVVRVNMLTVNKSQILETGLHETGRKKTTYHRQKVASINFQKGVFKMEGPEYDEGL